MKTLVRGLCSRGLRAARVLCGTPGTARDARLDEAKILAAQALIRQMKTAPEPKSLHDVEFRVFSQFGDDGILQYLSHKLDLPVARQSFIEFGVEDYSEANTRFLLINDNWRGLVIDGDDAHMRRLRASQLYWRHELTAVGAFITRETINELFAAHGFTGEIGLLSVDIDGNDYWVWEAVDVVDPALVVVEYNSVFGGRRAVSVPYDPAFRRTAAHYSNLYWGCSLAALCHLAQQKGYTFVGCNSNGNNAWFVRRELAAAAGLRELEPTEGYVCSRFRESRDQQGQLTYLGGDARRGVIAELPVVDVVSGETLKVRALS